MIGIAHEKTSAWRGFKAGGSASHPHFSYRRMSIFPNFFYISIRDREFGPGFIKTCAYAPWGVWIYLKAERSLFPGHRAGRRQAHSTGARRTRVGQASGRQARDRVPGARQWLSLGRGCRCAAGDLRNLLLGRHRTVLDLLGAAAALAVDRCGSRPRLRLPAVGPPARALGHARARPPGPGAGVV